MRFLLSFTLFLISFPVFAQITGKVVGVSDGDTFTLLTKDSIQYKIRLHGIDCPEKKQDFGQVAKHFTSDMIFGKVVSVKETDVDRYKRTIGIVLTPDGKVLNEELLKAGLAWHYVSYDKNKRWNDMERKAREKKIGLWQRKDAVAPWLWRKQQKGQRAKKKRVK